MTKRLPLLFCTLIAATAFLTPGFALAQTTTDGDVLPGSYPFTDIDIGVTSQSVNVFLSPSANQEEYERGDNIIIGRTGYGQVRVSGGDDLRWEHLILGGSEENIVSQGSGEGVDLDTLVASPTSSSNGVGVMRIEQLGSSFNNHPQVIPTIYQDIYFGNNNPESTLFPVPSTVNVDIFFDGSEIVTIDTERDTGIGFDAIIGLTGRGELYLNTGARMEIEDAFIVGYGPNSTGYVEVDGLGTYLAAYGGLRPNALGGPARNTPTSNDGIHQMIIGAYSQDAQLWITGGATVDAFYGAAIGVTRSDGDDELTDTGFDDPDDPQGRGYVYVDGPGSVWNIAISAFAGENPRSALGLDTDGGALAIGEFDYDTAGYSSDEGGAGYLSIRNEGRVNVSRYIEENNNYATDDDADVKIGFQGVLDFQGGRMNVTDQVVNDGVIQVIEDGQGELGSPAPGGGHLTAATFENRALGRVYVQNGQSLTVTANITTGLDAPGAPEVVVGANFGRIEVTGNSVESRSEFRYVRNYAGADGTTAFLSGSLRQDTVMPNGVELFYNAGESLDRGQIVASNAALRFDNGIWNSGDIQFIGGDNVFSGRVKNAADPTTMLPLGSISLSNHSYVAFEDAVTNDGTITLTAGSSAALLGSGDHPGPSTDLVAYHGTGELNLITTGETYVDGNFSLGDMYDTASQTGIGGTLRLYVEDFTADSFSHLLINGDADFGFDPATPSRIEVSGLLPGTLTPGDAINLITVLGTSDFTNATYALSLIAEDPAIAFSTDTSSGDLILRVVPLVIASIAGDYNNDNIVDAADYAVWRFAYENGLPLPFNESNNIGNTDLGDYLVWRQNYGMTFPALVAEGSFAAPEPSALALLSLMGVVAVRRDRRRLSGRVAMP